MKGRRRGALAAAALVGAVLLTGCAKPDRSEIVTWTDEHGRACTGVAIVDSEDGDREVSSIDCDYPPEGERPGRSTSAPLPD
ncbi:hypothetical protein [Streptomyces coeruleorubidus]|jgi:hypothetical protein|uniref:Secreted protein n=1 Tax=Streptomyces coeruleorubidus TaxID=116188 RepID=A0A5J6IAZ4_STRC4|nr:hypothetical protein [Streptomyces coeruleorubidus]QEV29369.1 hypothetical protein CP976_38145 [Streptomyces coeruleorubidus]GGT74893.1 hypothetical protein GCM10010256_37140 [Streptomyces coeruleorubidus]